MTKVYDADAGLVWSSEYTPFGEVAGVDGPYGFSGMYTGKDLDEATGLVYMWHRWQYPATGRFVSEDPARAGVNFYAYVDSRVLVARDPSGLRTFDSIDKLDGYEYDEHERYTADQEEKAEGERLREEQKKLEQVDSLGESPSDAAEAEVAGRLAMAEAEEAAAMAAEAAAEATAKAFVEYLESQADWGMILTVGGQGSLVGVGGATGGGGVVVALGKNGASFGLYSSFSPTIGSLNISGGPVVQIVAGASNPYVITGESSGLGGSLGISAVASANAGADIIAYTDTGYTALSANFSLGIDVPGITAEGHANPIIYTGCIPLIGVRK